MWWGYTLLVFFLGLIVWLWVPMGSRASPLLILAEGAEGTVEGVVRLAARADRAVFVRLVECGDATRTILQRLEEELPNVREVAGDLEDILPRVTAPVVHVVRLGKGTDVREVLRLGL